MTEQEPVKSKPEIPNGVIARILKLDEDMKSKKFRVQRDSLRAINISMALFLKLLTKTCEVVQSTSTASSGGKRAQNTLDLEHLAKAVNRYEVLSFMKDIVDEMNSKKIETQDLSSLSSMMSKLDKIDDERVTTSIKRKQQNAEGSARGDEENQDEDGNKKLKSSQMSLTSFFKTTNIE